MSPGHYKSKHHHKNKLETQGARAAYHPEKLKKEIPEVKPAHMDKP